MIHLIPATITFCVLLILPGMVAAIQPLVLVGCYDAQDYPPKFCANYTKELANLTTEIAASTFGDRVEIKEAGDWSFFLDSITLPHVIGGVVSLNVREESNLALSKLRQEEFISSFQRGFGIVGIHGLAYSPYTGSISQVVFPLNGSKIAPGKIHRGEFLTMRHTHEKASQHIAAIDLPDRIDIPDGGLVYLDPIPQDGYWSPETGEMTVLYVATGVKGRSVPSVVAYEKGPSRSMTIAGLRHHDGDGGYGKNMNWYNHSLSIPKVRTLLSRSLVWVLQSLIDSGTLEEKTKATIEMLGDRLAPVIEKNSEIEIVETRQQRKANLLTLSIAAISTVGTLLTAYLGFHSTENM